MKNHSFILSLFFFTFSILSIHAQEAIITTGGNASGSGGSVSYTVGQIVYSTNSGSNGSIAEGVQQPFEISVVNGIEQAKDIKLISTVFPNPTNENLTLKIENYKIENLSYQLFEISGKLIKGEIISSNKTALSLTNLPSGIYFLKVISNSKEIKTFKIIKNH